MARTSRFLTAVGSGYLLTTLSAGLNLITIPVALAFLGKANFGLWSAVAQTTALVAIFEMGIGPSLARFITDYKDDRNHPNYAQFLKSVFYVALIQGLLLAGAAVALVQFLPGLMEIEPEQTRDFQILLGGQLAIAAAGFPLRPLAQILYANQQIAKLNGCSIVSATVNACVLIFSLRGGFGVYSFLAASGASFLVMQIGLLYYVRRLGLLPSLKSATVSFRILRPLAVFSGNVFLIVIGMQLISFAPALIITRGMGIEAMAEWTVGTRLVFFAWQIIGRIPNSSEPAFWEMFARNERSRLQQRLTDITVVTGSLAALFGTGLMAFNPPFIYLWTTATVHWSSLADLSFAMWVTSLALASCFNMTPGISKRVGGLKFACLLEGIALVAIGYFQPFHLHSFWQVGLVLFLPIVLIRLPYGIRRTKKDFNIPAGNLFACIFRVVVILVLLSIFASVLRVTTSGLHPITRIAVILPAFGVIALPLVYCLGLPSEYRAHAQLLFKRLLGKVSGRLSPP